MHQDIQSALDRWVFMTLGVFTTCCYTRDFAALDLIRFPQTHPGNVTGNIATFELPNWFPHEHAILATSDGSLFSKLRDLPLPRQTKTAQNNAKLLGIQLPGPLKSPISVTLTYTPLFRFAHTGSPFSIEGSISRFVCRIFEYAARRSGIPTTPIQGSGDEQTMELGEDTDRIAIQARGVTDLRSLSISTNRGVIALDLEARYLQLGTALTPAIANALGKMIASGNTLKNCVVGTPDPHTIELRYRG